MLSVARRILGSDDLAWDAVQDALIALWHAPCDPSDLRGWLVRTVVHKSRHQARTLARRRRHEEAAARERGDEAADPTARLEQAELASSILRAVAGLSPEFRRVFRRCEIDGVGYAVVARELAIPLGTVRSRLHRARALLRLRLAHVMHDEDLCAICARLRRSRRRAS